MNEMNLANTNIKKLSLEKSIIKGSLDCKKTKIRKQIVVKHLQH